MSSLSDLIVYRSKYLNKEQTDSSLISLIGKENLKQYFIVHDRLKWEFLAFNSTSDYLIYRKQLLPDERCFHEQILGDEPQRIKFDIDAPKSYVDSLPNVIIDMKPGMSKMENIIMFIAETMVKVMNEDYEDELPYPVEIDNNILITESHGSNKYSYHIILVHFKLKNNIECKYFTGKVLRRMPEQIREIIDTQVNKGLQSFRLIGSVKEGTDRRKHISELSPIVDSGFIQDLDDTDTILNPKKDYAKEVKTGQYLPPNILAMVVDKVYTKWPEFAQFRDERDKFLNFNRLHASHCDFCGKIHDRDNSLLVTWEKSSKGIYYMRYSCRKYVGERTMETFMEIKDNPTDRSQVLSKMIEQLQSTVKDPEHRFGRYGRHVTIREESSIQDISNHTVCYIRAGMKMGKTKALIRYIGEIDRSMSICVLSFRLTFSQELHSKLPGFKLYNDIGGKILSSAHKRLIIQVESLSRLSGNYDIVVLDESESILNQFSSGNVKNLTLAFATFERVLSRAKKVIVMDAYLSDRSIDVVNFISGSEDYNIDYYTHQNAKDYIYHIGYYKHNNHFLKEMNKVLKEKVHTNPIKIWGLKNKGIKDCLSIINQFMGHQYRDKNIAIITNSKKEIDAIHKYILIENPHIDRDQIEKYTGATETNKKREHMKDIHTHWMKRVIIYTPTITAGLSFEKVWFDQIFAYFNNSSCDVLSCMQMLGRIRNLTDKKVTIAVDAKAINCSTSIEAIKGDIEFNRYNLLKNNCMNNIMLVPPKEGKSEKNQDYQIVENNYWYLWVYNTRNCNISRKRFIQSLCECILETGAKIAAYGIDKIGKEHQALMQVKKDIRTETAKAISLVSLPSQDELERIIHKIDEQEDLTVEEDLKFKKRRIQLIYNIEDGEKEVLDKLDFILQYNKPHVIDWYKHLKAITLKPDIKESLDMIRDIEQKRVNNIDSPIYKLEYKPTYLKHMATATILNGVFNISNFIEPKTIKLDMIIENIKKKREDIKKAYKIHELYPPSMTVDSIDEDILQLVKSLNRIPYAMYGHKVISENDMEYFLRNYTSFNVDKNGVKIDL